MPSQKIQQLCLLLKPSIGMCTVPSGFKVTMRSNEAWLLIHTFAIARFMCKAFGGVWWSAVVLCASLHWHCQSIIATISSGRKWSYRWDATLNNQPHIHPKKWVCIGYEGKLLILINPELSIARTDWKGPQDLTCNHQNICQGHMKLKGLKPPQVVGV